MDDSCNRRFSHSDVSKQKNISTINDDGVCRRISNPEMSNKDGISKMKITIDDGISSELTNPEISNEDSLFKEKCSRDDTSHHGLDKLETSNQNSILKETFNQNSVLKDSFTSDNNLCCHRSNPEISDPNSMLKDKFTSGDTIHCHLSNPEITNQNTLLKEKHTVHGVRHGFNNPPICSSSVSHKCHPNLKTSGQENTKNVNIADSAECDFKTCETSEGKNEKHNQKAKTRKGTSLLAYIAHELKRDYMLEYNEKKLKERRRKVYTFVKTPRELEKFLLFGLLLCMDVFLFILTFLPIRLLIATVSAVVRLCRSSHRSLLDPVQKIDFMKGIILVTVFLIIQQVDTSVLYHVVRVQSVIKLYVVYNMLDIADKLLGSFGQDILDALYYTATDPRDRRREHVGIIPHLMLSLLYVSLHTLLNLSQAIVLNVAINSFNKSLLTVMISNQFIEIKTSVFKRFEKNNLFQMSCSDARERFHYFILILVVAIRNLTEFDWKFEYACWTLAPFAAIVIGSEFIVDWFKHAFITKFNNIQPEVYTTYRCFLAKNILRSKQDTGFTGHTDQVSRRMGFSALPFAVLLIKIIGQCIKLSGWPGICFAVLGYLCLCAFKLLISIYIFGKAAEYVKEEAEKKGLEEKPYNPSWSFEPATSVEEVNGSNTLSSKSFSLGDS